MKRTPITRRTPIAPRSKKRAERYNTPEGQEALAYMKAVKDLPCCICDAPPPSDAHHVIHDRNSAARSSDFDVIPLCKAHHQHGPVAIHNAKRAWRAAFGPDHSYIEATKKRVAALVNRSDMQ